jgi:hypothetical protein
MKLQKLTYSLLAALVALGSTSCSDFLDTPTDTRVELKTTEQLRMLLVTGYPSTNYAWPCEIESDNLEDNNTPDSDGLRYNLSSYNRGDDEMFRWETCESNTDNDSPSSIWEGMYASIATANAVLEKLDEFQKDQDGVLDDTQSAIRGEALMIRAYGHFMLAQVFCMPYSGTEKNKTYLGIPYPTEPETTVKPNYQRGTLDETYAKIEADLEEGLSLVNNTLYDQPKYHFNQSAAYAFAARYYLFTRQYKKALDACNIALGSTKASDGSVAMADASPYMSTFWSNLDSFYYLSDMGLFQNGMDKQCNFLLMATYSAQVRHYSGSRRYSLIRDALNATVHGSSPAWSAFRWSQSNGKGSTFTMHPCFNGCTFINGSSEYGYFIGANIAEQFEYTDKVAGIGYAHVTKREFYGEEVLLTRAEARLFLGDTQGAVDDLSVWEKARRNCPGASGYQDKFVDLTIANINAFYADKDPGYGIAKPIHIDEVCPESDALVSADAVMGVLQCIQHFRRIETLHQGMRWFDIKRYGIEITHVYDKAATTDVLTLNDPRRAMQLPAEVTAAGMQANPREVFSVEENTERVVPAN